MTTPVSSQAPTRVRYLVIVFAVALAVITYIDRVCMSQAAPVITKDLGLTVAQKGYIFSAFALAYALFEIPGGYLGDRIGARRVLMRVVMWWSAFTAATGLAWNFTSMATTQFLFGVGEAGCFPNLTKAFTTWLPIEERVRAQGILWMAARWGGAFTPPLVALVLKWMNWRQAFMLFGAIGLVWAFAFYRWYRDNPRDNPHINAAEMRIIEANQHLASAHGSVPWGLFLRSKQVWLLCAQYFCLSFSWYFYITWLPTYLLEARHLTVDKGSLLASLPLLFGGFGSLACGDILSGDKSLDPRRRVKPPLARRHRVFWSRGDVARLERAPGRHDGDVCHGPVQLLQRPGDAGKLGRLHGRRRKICGDALRHDEHGGQYGRLALLYRHRLYLEPHRKQLGHGALPARGNLFCRGSSSG